ncbi:unnamed protein product [Prunus armeniaca]|uniref:Uncharacterized protein n=1 Tax=Prunus armeniaca TaxID=36596 RepID=A0A6J5Y064_PRUAR|nr:unnamed protein product [Prunus armeniaca]
MWIDEEGCEDLVRQSWVFDNSSAFDLPASYIFRIIQHSAYLVFCGAILGLCLHISLGFDYGISHMPVLS